MLLERGMRPAALPAPGAAAPPPTPRPQVGGRSVRCRTSTVGRPPVQAAEPTSRCPVARLMESPRPTAPEPQQSEAPQNFSHDTFDYLPFTGPMYQVPGRFKMTMGLQPMPPSELIEIDECYDEEIALRRKLLKESRDIVLQSTPEADDANKELLEILAAYLPGRFPDRFAMSGRQLTNFATGDIWDLDDLSLDALEVVSLLVQEDVCLLVPNKDGHLVFVSGAVLFPQRWSLLQKMGMDMKRIHEPVPFYESSVRKNVDAFMERICPGKPFWRVNWSLNTCPDLYQPLLEEEVEVLFNAKKGEEEVPVTAENAGDRLTLRCERETLSRLPRSQAVLFTIRTHLRPLKSFEQRPQQARELATAIRNLPHDLAAYKTIATFREAAAGYLEAVADKGLAKA